MPTKKRKRSSGQSASKGARQQIENLYLDNPRLLPKEDMAQARRKTTEDIHKGLLRVLGPLGPLDLLLLSPKDAETGRRMRDGARRGHLNRKIPDYLGKFKKLNDCLQRERLAWSLEDIWVDIGKDKEVLRDPRTVEKAVRKAIPDPGKWRPGV